METRRFTEEPEFTEARLINGLINNAYNFTKVHGKTWRSSDLRRGLDTTLQIHKNHYGEEDPCAPAARRRLEKIESALGPEITVAPLEVLEKKFGKNIGTNGEKTGGWYDGKRTYIEQDAVQQAIFESPSNDAHLKKIAAIREHEEYHANNEHTKGLKGGTKKEDGRVVFMISGMEFTAEELIEGINTIHTGDSMPQEFRSPTYKDHANKILTAISSSKNGLTLLMLTEAINKTKDLSHIVDFPEFF